MKSDNNIFVENNKRNRHQNYIPTTVQQQTLVWVTLGYEPNSVMVVILDDRFAYA